MAVVNDIQFDRLLIPIKRVVRHKGFFHWPSRALLASPTGADIVPIRQLVLDLKRHAKIEVHLVRHAFGIHAEICLDADIAADRLHIPTENGMISGGYEQIKKRYVRPSQGWCASTGKNSLIAMLFPDKLLDGVEVYYPEVGTHLNLSPLIYYIGLAPGKEARFTCAMYFGEGDADFAAELWKNCADGLLSQYVSVSGDRLEMAAEFEAPEMAQMPEGDEKSEERRWLIERMNELEKHKEERMEVLRLLRDKQINLAEAIRRLKGGKAV